jgi:hypothetical protein
MRPRITLLSILLVLVCVAVASLLLILGTSGLLTAGTFAGLQNMTERQVLDRCGPPVFDSRVMPQDPNFELGYYTWMGERFIVVFCGGRVTQCYSSGSK